MKSELYILGVLHRGDFHPYEIKRRLQQAMLECFTDVDTGTLYYAVRQLAEDGLLSAVAHERVARGGVRTVYRITAHGRQRFQELLHEQFRNGGGTTQALYGPMLFLHLANLEVVAEALRMRIQSVKSRLSAIGQLQKKWGPRLPSGSRLMIKQMANQCRIDLRWLSEVVAEIEAGRVRDTPDPAGLASLSAKKSEKNRKLKRNKS
jgi:DNA-binding PadR family transcriptional regulator